MKIKSFSRQRHLSPWYIFSLILDFQATRFELKWNNLRVQRSLGHAVVTFKAEPWCDRPTLFRFFEGTIVRRSGNRTCVSMAIHLRAVSFVRDDARPARPTCSLGITRYGVWRQMLGNCEVSFTEDILLNSYNTPTIYYSRLQVLAVRFSDFFSFKSLFNMMLSLTAS